MIVAGTGAGKSYFVKKVLRHLLKERKQKCLYLLSRVKTVEQFKNELQDDTTIQFMTYQSVESIKSNPYACLNGWDMIIADECHYFLDDSNFNNRTDISFDWIMEQNKAIRLFMTATGDGIEEYFCEQRIMFTQYCFSGDYTHVRNLNFFWDEIQLTRLAKDIIASGQRGVFFIQSAERAYRLYEQFKDNGMYLCSVHNKKYKSYMDNSLVEKLLLEEKFDCSLLFSTTALDTGANIRDECLTNIIIDVTDPTRVIQCIGRKRFISENDYLDLYIRGRSNKQIGGLIRKLEETVKIVKKFDEQGAVLYNAANGRRNDDSGLIFDAPLTEEYGEVTFSKHVNKLKYAQIRQDIRTYQKMISYGAYGYTKYIAKLLGRENDYTVLEKSSERQSLTTYLDSIADVPLLTPREREPLIDHLDVRRNRRLCKSYRVLAAWLESSGLPYRLLEYSTSRLIDGVKKNFKAWKVIALE